MNVRLFASVSTGLIRECLYTSVMRVTFTRDAMIAMHWADGAIETFHRSMVGRVECDDDGVEP